MRQIFLIITFVLFLTPAWAISFEDFVPQDIDGCRWYEQNVWFQTAPQSVNYMHLLVERVALRKESTQIESYNSYRKGNAKVFKVAIIPYGYTRPVSITLQTSKSDPDENDMVVTDGETIFQDSRLDGSLDFVTGTWIKGRDDPDADRRAFYDLMKRILYKYDYKN